MASSSQPSIPSSKAYRLTCLKSYASEWQPVANRGVFFLNVIHTSTTPFLKFDLCTVAEKKICPCFAKARLCRGCKNLETILLFLHYIFVGYVSGKATRPLPVLGTYTPKKSCTRGSNPRKASKYRTSNIEHSSKRKCK